MNEIERNSENQVSLEIYDFKCTPDELTGKIGVTPSEKWTKGDIKTVGKAKIRIRQNTWSFNSPLNIYEPIEKHIKYLLDAIKPHEEMFIKFTRDCHVDISCGIYFYEVNPGIHLDPEIIAGMARINAALDLDMYCLGSTSEADNTDE